MLKTFAWCPDPGANVQHSHRNVTAQFGDGYEQVVGDGINTYRDTWQLTFNRDLKECKLIEAFVNEHRERVPFWWTPPYGTKPERYTASGMTTDYPGGLNMVVKFTMRRVYRNVK